MNHRPTQHRRRAQRGGASRGVLVAAGFVAALGLQLAGPQLQCRLASLVGIARIAPSATPASMAAPMPIHGYKVAQVVASAAPRHCAAPAI
jgi:hypothetical protein